jgi:hypothetical protein
LPDDVLLGDAPMEGSLTPWRKQETGDKYGYEKPKQRYKNQCFFAFCLFLHFGQKLPSAVNFSKQLEKISVTFPKAHYALTTN